jgi:hypothetical protein
LTTSDDPGCGEDRLDDLKAQVAEEHLGDGSLGSRLRGGNHEQLRADAERLREQAHVPGSGRPSAAAAVWCWQRERRALHERLFGKSAP